MPLLNPRFPEGLRRIFATLGEGGPLELAEELFAVQPLPDDPFNAAPIGLKYWMGRAVASAGGAGVRSEVLIRNPVGSGMLSAIVLLIPGTVNAADLFLSAMPVAGTAVPAGFSADVNALRLTDGRFIGASGVPATQLFEKTTLAASSIVAQATLEATSAERFPIPIWPPSILVPGSHVTFQATADNLLVDIAIAGVERVARQEELTFT